MRQEVRPWLAQMGAERIIPELQELAVGMIFPALPGATDGFTVLAFEPQHFLVLGWTTPDGAHLMTWTDILEDDEHGSTRLIVRARAGPGYRFLGLPWWATKRIVATIHFVMQRKQLLGIARRVERGATIEICGAEQP